MKAAVQTRYGPPEVVRVVEVPDPAPREHEVLVRIHVATVNRTDCGFRAGKPWIVRLFSGPIHPRVKTLGTEFAGEVAAVGGGVTRFAVGDRVFGYNEPRFGAHAEYLVLREDGPLATIPETISSEQAAASTEGSHYALGFIRSAKVGRGQRVLVNGATGGIGSAAVQLLKDLGASVTATSATEHAELVLGLGADRVIDYTAEDFTEDEETYDVVIDAVGKSSFGRCKPLLAPHGVYLSSELGPFSMHPFRALVNPLLPGKRIRFPIPKRFDQEAATYFRGLLASGAFTPVIDRSYPLDQIVEAYRYVETGQKIGNVVIRISGT